MTMDTAMIVEINDVKLMRRGAPSKARGTGADRRQDPPGCCAIKARPGQQQRHFEVHGTADKQPAAVLPFLGH